MATLPTNTAIATVPYGAFGEEVAVLSDELLQRLITSQAPEAVRAYGKAAGSEDKDVLYIRIDFQSILKIDNLQSFVGLRKLQLDNNLIERIENLDMLVNLEWLDLSFNHLTKIEGLSKLTKLSELSLAHNRLTTLEGLEALVALDVLSVGGNAIESLEEPVLYLRQFKHLRSVTLADNPLTTQPTYPAFALAFLSVRYLDFRRVSDEARATAVVKYTDRLEVIQAKEAEEAEVVAKANTDSTEDKKFADACVKGFNGGDTPKFLRTFLDPEVDKLRPIPSIHDILTTFLTMATTRLKALGELGLAQRARRRGEAEELTAALRSGREEVRQISIQLVESFNAQKRQVQDELAESSKGPRGKLESLRRLLQDTKDQLLGLEIELVSNTEDAVRRFERSYADLTSSFNEQVQATFGEVRDAEATMHKDLTDVASLFLERFLKGEIENAMELPDSLIAVLNDKTTLTNLINGVHDTHLLAIDTKEDESISAANRELEAVVATLQEAEHKRNRSRVAEICDLIGRELDELSGMDDI